MNQTFTKHSVSFSLEKLSTISAAQTKHGELGEALVAAPKKLLTHTKKKKKVKQLKLQLCGSKTIK